MKKTLEAPHAVRARFDDWFAPRRGNSNPENQTNDVWSWLIETRAWPHAAHRAAGTGKKPAPGWCFSRFGQSKTLLADGTTVYIGGEHEDHYDPDFYIYNDVVAVRPDGSIEIYGYPVDVFPPTDSHSATLTGEAIIIIGSIGYPADRVMGETHVYRLQLSDFSIQRGTTSGQGPSWLFKHDAELDPERNRIVCTGGEVLHDPSEAIVENLTTWEFDLETHAWEAGETKPFTRWLLMRADESRNELWRIEEVAKADRMPREGRSLRRWLNAERHAGEYRARFAERGHTVDTDLFFGRFSPPLPHEVVEPDPDRDEYRTHRIRIDGVVVRTVEESYQIAVAVEGDLSPERLEALKAHGLETYGRLEGVAYKIVPL